MNNFKKIITAFSKRTLGGLAGEILLDDYAKKYSIPDLSILNKRQQKQFIDAFLWGVFHRHLPREKIDSIRLQLNFHFSLDEATDKISVMLNKQIQLDPLDMKYQSFENFEKIVNNLDEGIVMIPVSVSGYMTANLLIFIYRDSAIKLGNIMLQSMMGMTKTDEYLDDMKQSAIKEFFNIVVPTFADTIANTLGQKILFNIPEAEITEVQTELNNVFSRMDISNSDNYGIKKIMSTPINLEIEKKDNVKGMAFLLLETEPEIISTSLDSTGIKVDDTLEKMDLDSIEIPKTQNRYHAIIAFLRNFFKEDPTPIIDNLMEEMGIASLNTISTGVRRKFVTRIMNDNFARNSPKVVDFINRGCSTIFNLGTASIHKSDTDENASKGTDALSGMVKKS